ncbi:MAG: GMC family oxidoreductase N-terminal domain-containing protein [Pseudomonadota bacterium]
MDRFDYIVIGAGSAGCVLADRLSADGRSSVLVLEAGGSDLRTWIKLPIGYGKTFHDASVNWRFRTQPDRETGDREHYWPRGKVLGGSSSINGLVYSRGLPGDFDDWEMAGNPGWGWEDVAPVFDRIENHVAPDGSSKGQGPISVTDTSKRLHPIKRHYLSAAKALDLPEADPDQAICSEGVAPYRITTRNGLRCSAADAFLRPAMRRSNLTIRTHCMVDRIEMTEGRATDIHYSRGGKIEIVTARREILLCAGAIASPMILQRSGIGPGAALRDLGIDVLHDNPAVGGGLQDHLGVDYLFKATEPTLNQSLGTLFGQVSAGLEFILTRKGPLSLSVNQMGGMVRSDANRDRANIQLYFNPLSYSTVWKDKRPLLKPDPWPGFNFGFNACRPTSRGRVGLNSSDANDTPKIDPGYLTTNEDIADVLAGARLIERFLKTDAMRELIADTNGFNPEGASDEEILSDFRARCWTVFHVCGTCRMGPEAEGGVVGSDLKLHGVDGLRVVDASVFPNVTSANTNAPTMMTAMKAADFILDQNRLSLH